MPAPDVAAQIESALAPLPLHRKIPAILGGVLAVAGVAWLKATLSWSGAAYAALMFVAGLVLIALAYIGAGNQEASRNAG